LPFGKYFLGNTDTKPSHLVIESGRRLYIYFLAKNFKANEMKGNLTNLVEHLEIAS